LLEARESSPFRANARADPLEEQGDIVSPRILVAVLVYWVAALNSPAQIVAEETPFQTDVFVGGEGGYHAYRIPSLIVTPSGALLVFCEARKANLSDDGDIDLLLRRSDDNGRTWLKPQLIVEEGGDARIKFGNPTAFVDHETKTVWVAVNRDYLDQKGARQGGSLLLLRSNDDGKTWSKPIDITEQVKLPDWGHYAFGPGLGIQLMHGADRGRLVVPANFRESFDKRQPSWSHVIYSDDHGKTWRRGGKLGKFTNECQVAEVLEHGKSALLFNARNHWGRGGVPAKSGHRLIARSTDGGLTWSDDLMDRALSDPPCQASLFRFGWEQSGEKSLLLFANPAGPGRKALTIRGSTDEGRTWPHAKTVYPGSSAYSCMARLADGRIGMIYERDSYGKLTFTSFSREWLTSPVASPK